MPKDVMRARESEVYRAYKEAEAAVIASYDKELHGDRASYIARKMDALEVWFLRDLLTGLNDLLLNEGPYIGPTWSLCPRCMRWTKSPSPTDRSGTVP